MSWPAIDKVRLWAGKRKNLPRGLVSVAIEETVALVPGARLAVRLVGEVAKHGVLCRHNPRLISRHLGVVKQRRRGTVGI